MRKFVFLNVLAVLFTAFNLCAQVSVNNDGSAPNTSAMLEVKSNNKGFLPPRMTWSQIQAIPSPSEGLVVYDIGIKSIRMYNGNEWVVMGVRELSLTDPPGHFSSVVAKGNGTAAGHELLISSNKTFYVAGTFIGSIQIGNSVIGPSVGSNDAFIAAFDSVSTLLWIKVISGDMEEKITDMEFDQSGNIIITGFFRGTLDLDPGAGTDIHVSTGAFSDDIFFAKYNTNGDFIWGKHIGGTSSDQSHSIIADPTGNIYLTGIFYGTVDFDPGPGTANLTSTGGTYSDLYLARYDSDGTWIWSNRLGNTSYEFLGDLEWLGGTILLGGSFNETMDFDPSTGGVFNLTSAGNDDVFFARYDINGGFLWAKKIGGTSTEQLWDIAVDASGNFWALGIFSGTSDMDPDAGVVNLVSSGGDNTYFAKYQSSGALLLAKGIGASGPSDSPSKLVLDQSGNVYICGSFVGSGTQMDFDPGFDGLYLVSHGPSYDWYIAKYTPLGTYVWVTAMGGTHIDKCNTFSVSADGKFIIATGSLLSTSYISFNGERIINSTQFYIARYEE